MATLLIQQGNFVFKGNTVSPLQRLPLPTHVQHNVVLLALNAMLIGWIGHGQLQIDHIPVQVLKGALQLQRLACVEYLMNYHNYYRVYLLYSPRMLNMGLFTVLVDALAMCSVIFSSFQ